MSLLDVIFQTLFGSNRSVPTIALRRSDTDDESSVAVAIGISRNAVGQWARGLTFPIEPHQDILLSYLVMFDELNHEKGYIKLTPGDFHSLNQWRKRNYQRRAEGAREVQMQKNQNKAWQVPKR